jgi:hypothetical protein
MCPTTDRRRHDTSGVTSAQALSEERDPAGRRRLSASERRVEIVAAALFVASAAAMLTAADGWDDPLSAVLLTAAYALVDRVLLGARVIVTGLSAESTGALVASGVDLRGVHAVADLQRGIEEAERLL